MYSIPHPPRVDFSDSFHTLSSKGIRGAPISAPVLKSTTSASTYTPPSPHNSAHSFDKEDCSYDARSDITQYAPYAAEPKALGSVADLSLNTPSTLAPSTPWTANPDVPEDVDPQTPLSSLSPVTPPSRLRPLVLSQASSTPSSRPFTYPSHEASHQGINPPNPDAF